MSLMSASLPIWDPRFELPLEFEENPRCATKGRRGGNCYNDYFAEKNIERQPTDKVLALL